MRSKKKKSSYKGLFFLAFLLLVGATFVYIYKHQKKTYRNAIEAVNPGGKEAVILHYGDSINKAAITFNLSAPYLKALCMLECSGRKIVPPRFEAHVYKKLKQVKEGKLSQYEHVTPAMLYDATDDALKNLASSWGPFQLMGYKCLLLNIKIADIRGEHAIYWGAKWINETYGNKIRQGKYKDAFHLHNTGKPYPKMGKPRTYHPDYVPNGLAFMEYYAR